MYGCQPLNLQNILIKISEEDIFRRYISYDFIIDKNFVSELRDDTNPSVRIGYFNNRLKYKDFGDGSFFDCFDYVKYKFNLSFTEALQKINDDFDLNLVYIGDIISNPISKETSNTTKIKKRTTDIKVYSRKWNIKDKEYWLDKYNINTKDLKHFNVFPVLFFKINNIPYTPDSICYAYRISNKWKIYSPFSVHKWISNCTIDDIQGLDQLPSDIEDLIITSSLKDIIVLYKLGYAAIAPSSELSLINNEILSSIKYKRLFTLFDNDNTGHKASELFKKIYNCENIYLSQYKDPSDFVEAIDYNTLNIEITESFDVKKSYKSCCT